MDSLIISPRTPQEMQLLSDLLLRMNIATKVISDEEKENIGLLAMMQEADLSDTVSREEIMGKLGS